MIAIVWEFRIPIEQAEEFEQIYGPGGDWARLFRKASGYIETQLLADPEDGGRYITIDRWNSHDDFQRFISDHGDDYRALDRRCESLTTQERHLGTLTVVGADQRRSR